MKLFDPPCRNTEICHPWKSCLECEWRVCVSSTDALVIYFLWPPYAPALVNGGSRNFYTWRTLSVNREVTTWIIFWSSLNYRVGQKNDAIWYIFRPRPQTFCSHARTRQNIVILKKILLSTDGCSTRFLGLVNFGLQTHEIHASYNCFFLRNLA